MDLKSTIRLKRVWPIRTSGIFSNMGQKSADRVQRTANGKMVSGVRPFNFGFWIADFGLNGTII